MLEEIGLFHLADDRMRYLTAQQSVIARNIANADTPGYQAQDLAPFQPAAFTHSASGNAPLALASTEPGHFGIASGGASNSDWSLTPAPVASYGEKPNGNTVSLEEQMMKQADVANNFALATAAYSKSLSILKAGIDFGK
jgi:flagellar basal-body rod protein FlgB